MNFENSENDSIRLVYLFVFEKIDYFCIIRSLTVFQSLLSTEN